MIDALTGGTAGDLGHLGLLGLGLTVAVGSLVPVLPTGALVAASSVVALSSATPALALTEVFLVSALGAFVGDAVLLLLAEGLGGPFLHRIARHADPATLARAHHRLADHELGVLVVSRLLPAGRIPVLVAVVLVEFPVRRFLVANVVAVLVWALWYLLLGTAGGSVFDEPWQGVLTAIALVTVASAVPAVRRRARDRRRDGEAVCGRRTG